MKYLCSFYTPNFSSAARWFSLSASKKVSADSIQRYTPRDLDSTFKMKFRKHLSVRKGAGLWCWKFFLIQKFLTESKPGDLMFYSDIAVLFVNDPFTILRPCLQQQGFVLFENNGLEYQLTKKEVFSTLGLSPSGSEGLGRQVYGGNFFIENCQKSKMFFNEAANLFSDFELARDVEECEMAEQHQGFLFHRHDQSIISLLAKQKKLNVCSDIAQYGNLDRDFESDHYLIDRSRRLPQILVHTRRSNDFSIGPFGL